MRKGIKEAGMQTIRTLEEVDLFLEQVNNASRVSDDAVRSVFRQFKMAIEWNPPADPYSSEYRDAVLSLYEYLHGKPYTIKHEISLFDVESATISPFPYYTKSCDTVGNHLMAIGHSIRVMNLQPGATILEFGPGWGNTTLALAAMGFKVTAVDIEPRFCDLIARRAANNGLSVNVINADFSYIDSVAEPVDAVLFFECFHHASDHMALLRALHGATTSNGRVFFAAEPITEDFPAPWGLRLDGESLWAIRKNGWLELGYNEKYFFDTMDHLGWRLYKHVTTAIPWGTVFEACKSVSMRECFKAGDQRLKSQIGQLNQNNELVGCGVGFLVFGPYICLPAGSYTGSIAIRSTEQNKEGVLRCEIAHGCGSVILSPKEISLKDIGADWVTIEIPFILLKQQQDVEFRVWLNSPALHSVKEIVISG